MKTNIYIRAYIDNHYVSIDIGDPELNAEQLLHWLATKDDEFVLRTMQIVRKTLQQEMDNNGKT